MISIMSWESDKYNELGKLINTVGTLSTERFKSVAVIIIIECLFI